MDDKILKHKLEAIKNSRSKFENISKLLNTKKNSLAKAASDELKTPSSN